MVSVLDKIRKVFGAEDLVYTPDHAAIDNAKRAGADTWEPPVPTLEQKLLCLERQYYFVRKQQPLLKLSGEQLLQLEPSNLNEKEMNAWYWGLRQEACGRLMQIANQSYSKKAVREWQDKEGLTNAIALFDPGTRESFESVLKYLSD